MGGGFVHTQMSKERWTDEEEDKRDPIMKRILLPEEIMDQRSVGVRELIRNLGD